MCYNVTVTQMVANVLEKHSVTSPLRQRRQQVLLGDW